MLKKQPNIWVNGPVGKLETIYLSAQGAARGVAVINHPNPLQGGLNTNKVVQTAAKALTELGFHCYLPNLRGVGNSDGEHDYGRGEVADCLAVVDFARQQHPDAQKLVIAGFSFGGYVSLFSALTARPDALLLLGPAIGMYTIDVPQAYNPATTLLIHGEKDEVVPIENSLKWAESQDMPVVVIPGSGHFFHGKLIVLRQWIERLFPALLKNE
ncbi:alpha/beta hydrolase [Snodgrassella sp. B3882]|uniref:alpha/beta hydrolase n=1 Tax=Snodgrassella sp. B3882 TaxID=2818037 RepID=UPI00226A03F7|nr:alpha/beta hydrolase [Snodgrassella sp. B3882]MCX8744400.1 alpha/beta hydrolase [Snodgrassella sp. B3882]